MYKWYSLINTIFRILRELFQARPTKELTFRCGIDTAAKSNGHITQPNNNIYMIGILPCLRHIIEVLTDLFCSWI